MVLWVTCCWYAGPSHSTSLVTDILSVPANMDTSLSAPPGDPTLTLTPRQPGSKSRLKPSKTQDKPPLAPRPLVTDEPLTTLGLGSPDGLSQMSHGVVADRASKSGRQTDSDAEASTSSSSPHAQVASSNMMSTPQHSGDSSKSNHAAPTARSRLTEDLAAAVQQDEERRASNAQAESSLSSPATATKPSGRNGFLSRLVGSSNKGTGSNGQQQAPVTPFELASQQFLEEQEPVSSVQQPATMPHSSESGRDAQLPSHATGPGADEQGQQAKRAPHGQQAEHAQHGQQAKHAQHGQAEGEPIGGSPAEVANRLKSSLQVLG